MFKKIVIIGPESTGKSTLCEQLAKHYHTTWVPEYAREYLLQHGADYSYEDLSMIAAGQINSEDKISSHASSSIQNSGFIFIDTDLYVMKVWSEFVFNKCDNKILSQIAIRQYDLYLLCNIDLPWVPDGLREYPDLKRRAQLFNMYRDIMINQQVAWVEISGNYDERYQIAVDAVNKLPI